MKQASVFGLIIVAFSGGCAMKQPPSRVPSATRVQSERDYLVKSKAGAVTIYVIDFNDSVMCTANVSIGQLEGAAFQPYLWLASVVDPSAALRLIADHSDSGAAFVPVLVSYSGTAPVLWIRRGKYPPKVEACHEHLRSIAIDSGGILLVSPPQSFYFTRYAIHRPSLRRPQ